MLKEKELLKIEDIKIIKRKIIIDNIINSTNYSLEDFYIFKQKNLFDNKIIEFNYCGIPLDSVNIKKLNEYKDFYLIIKRYIYWILNNCKKRNLTKSTQSYIKDDNIILNKNSTIKTFSVSDKLIWRKLEKSLSVYRFTIVRNNLNSILESYFNEKEYTSGFFIDYKIQKKMLKCQN